MIDKLMQEVQYAAVNFQAVTAKLRAVEAHIVELRDRLRIAGIEQDNLDKELAQARTRLTRAALALDPSTSLES